MRSRFGPLLAASLLFAACAKPPLEPSRLEAIVSAARAHPPCDTVVPMEWPTGFPVPLKTDQGLRFKFFFYPVAGSPATGPEVYSPGGQALVDPATGRPVTCELLAAGSEKLSRRRWPADVAGLGMNEFLRRQTALYAKTEAVAQIFAAGKGSAAAANDYLRAFKATAEPDLLPYYYRLNPSFWEWLRETAGDSIPKA